MNECVVCGEPTANTEQTRSYGQGVSVVKIALCKECLYAPTQCDKL